MKGVSEIEEKILQELKEIKKELQNIRSILELKEIKSKILIGTGKLESIFGDTVVTQTADSIQATCKSHLD